MDTVKLYHVADNGLQEGEALGRISVVLKADYEVEIKRLQAERDTAFADKETMRRYNNEANDRIEAIQSELTKARELLIRLRNCKWIPTAEWQHEVSEVIAHQSAPAANGGSDE